MVIYLVSLSPVITQKAGNILNKLVVQDEQVGKQNVTEVLWLLLAALKKLLKERHELRKKRLKNNGKNVSLENLEFVGLKDATFFFLKPVKIKLKNALN